MPDWLAAAIASGRVVDAIIALIVVEAIVLGIRYRMRGAGLAPVEFLPNLAAGLALALALRAVMAHAAWPWIALALAGSGIAHAIDLRVRLRHRT